MFTLIKMLVLSVIFMWCDIHTALQQTPEHSS